jgi:hypothetical protein
VIRNHPWRSLTVASLAVIPIGAYLLVLEVWWAYQGRKRFQR